MRASARSLVRAASTRKRSSVAEVERLVRVAREFDIRSVKFTGGEPLVRTDMEDIVSHTVRHMSDVSLTTNGSMLANRAEGLRNAGLKRVNVSIDSLDPTAFQAIRHGALPRCSGASSRRWRSV